MPERNLQGKVVAITGGARGIGAATARMLADEGARVAIGDLDGELATDVAADIGRDTEGCELDVRDRESVERFIDAVESDIGPLDTLVNNAGIAPTSPLVTDQPPAVIERTIAVNLNGVINGTNSAVRRMSGRGSGQVVNVASLAGINGVKGLSAYSASKFGVVGFTESIRIEFEGSGLVFTCVMPGPVRTDMMDGTADSPMIKLIPPEQVAAAIVGAMKSGRERVPVPKSVGAIARFASLLPPRAAIRLNRLLGMDRVYAEVDPPARADYVQRTTGDIES
ncbi:MAG: SDR family oxidoreductase [Acidobacteriota bacterium]